MGRSVMDAGVESIVNRVTHRTRPQASTPFGEGLR
jgi:hypothetical protein